MERDYIFLGDCYDMLAQLPDASIDAVITDPPYGMLNKNNPHTAWDSPIELGRWWAEVERIAKEDAAIVMFGSGIFSALCAASNPRLFRYSLVWDKHLTVGHLNANKMPLRRHEDILVFYRRLPSYHPQMTKTEPHIRAHKRNKPRINRHYGSQITYDTFISDEKYPTSIISIPQERNNAKGSPMFHPTQKPLPLLEYLVKTYTDEGDTVLDPFMGSGTTAVAALRTGRHFIGSEMLEEYHAKSLARIDAARAGLARERGWKREKETEAIINVK